MKKIIFAFFFIAISLNLYSQQFPPNEVAVGDFVKRMYDRKPFEGVKIIQDYDSNYLISVVVYPLDASTNEYVLKRASSLQARANANSFVEEAVITPETIINTTEEAVKDSLKTKSEMVEVLKNTVEGWALLMDLLTNFDVSEGEQRVFVYIRDLSK